MAPKRTEDAGPAGPETSDLIWLLGQPPLTDYLAFVANRVVDGATLDPRRLVAEWSRANDRFYDLESVEAGIADAIEVLPIEADLAPRVRRLKRNPWFRQSFDNLPFEIVKVEIDRLVVSQVHVERGHVATRAQALDANEPAALFDFCLPAEPAPPAVIARALAEGRWLFTSRSTDFRAHTPRLVAPGAVSVPSGDGPIATAILLGIGFGSNFVSGIRSGSRILLQNGYHRVFALRDRGIRHAYCVVETVGRKDELRLTATEEVGADPEFYFAARRPPIFRDFFDPHIAKALVAKAVDTHVEVEITVRSGTSVVSAV